MSRLTDGLELKAIIKTIAGDNNFYVQSTVMRIQWDIDCLEILRLLDKLAIYEGDICILFNTICLQDTEVLFVIIKSMNISNDQFITIKEWIDICKQRQQLIEDDILNAEAKFSKEFIESYASISENRASVIRNAYVIVASEEAKVASKEASEEAKVESEDAKVASEDATFAN